VVAACSSTSTASAPPTSTLTEAASRQVGPQHPNADKAGAGNTGTDQALGAAPLPGEARAASVAAPAGFLPVSASFVTPAEGWLLGRSPCASGACTTVLHTVDGGAHWSAVGAPNAAISNRPGIGADPAQVAAIRFTSKLDGWIWGPSLYATHDGGTTWRSVDAKPVLALDAASGTAWALVAACGELAGCTQVQLLHSSTANDLWSPTDDVISSENLAVQLRVEPSQRWVLAGGMVFAARTGDRLAGLATPCDDPTTPVGLATNDDRQVVVQCRAAGANELTLSDDAGAHWSTPFSAPAAIDQVASNGQGTLLGAASGGATNLSRSSDGGQTWTTVAALAEPGAWTDLSFLSADDAIAVLWDRALWASHDGGATWAAVPPSG